MKLPRARSITASAVLLASALAAAGAAAQPAAQPTAQPAQAAPLLQPAPAGGAPVAAPAASAHESPSLGIGAPTSGGGGAPFAAGGSLTLEPGLYRCELNRRVVVRRIAPDGQSLVVNWDGKDHTLNAVQARTGALRYEDAQAGLMWLVIVGKSMLLDMRAGKQLANECKL